ncbi:MAG: hypothetical protein KME19_03060 [Microcoleus vaginatus WJT46-NPBG5]|jgi:FtsZ-binding cell division protein ZapB|nr:hypothetical protein [Microcoleus vaginatus WJT46-NPBG5]
MQKIEPSLQTVTNPTAANPLSRRHWLELAEYASVAGSAVGTLAAAVSQQFVFAAAPLTLAVSLNLLNRSRMAQQPRLPEPAAINSLTSSFDDLFPFSQPPELFDSPVIQDEIAHLRQSLNELAESTAAAMVEVRQQLAEVRQSVSHSESTDLNPIYQALSQLQGVTERLETHAFKEDDWERLNVQFFLIQEAIADLKNTTTQMQERENEPSDFNDIEAVLAQIHAAWQAQIDELMGRMEQLEHKNREIIKPYLQRLVSEVKQLQKQSAKAGRS